MVCTRERYASAQRQDGMVLTYHTKAPLLVVLGAAGELVDVVFGPRQRWEFEQH